MYFDTSPCAVCGDEVRLRDRRPPAAAGVGDLVGAPDGVVGDADSTVDERECTNPQCPTNTTEGSNGPTP
jgi:hypothetical protein